MNRIARGIQYKKEAFKTKASLDTLSETEISEHEIRLLSNPYFREMPEQIRYHKELSLYISTRFKDSVYEQFTRWRESEDDLANFLTGNFDDDMLYRIRLATDYPKDENFVYITPDIPKEVDKTKLLELVSNNNKDD